MIETLPLLWHIAHLRASGEVGPWVGALGEAWAVPPLQEAAPLAAGAAPAAASAERCHS